MTFLKSFSYPPETEERMRVRRKRGRRMVSLRESFL
jgi:hypothetical protein